MIIDTTKTKIACNEPEKMIHPDSKYKPGNILGTHFTWVYRCRCDALNALPHHRWYRGFTCYHCGQKWAFRKDSGQLFNGLVLGFKYTPGGIDSCFPSIIKNPPEVIMEL
ncbi:MAG: hypothetical protein ACXAC5_03385 [Promethearchaeota archaeon]|jgi:hypothetical protein